MFAVGDRYGLAWLDLSAGRFNVMEVTGAAAPRRKWSACVLPNVGARWRAIRTDAIDAVGDRPWRTARTLAFRHGTATRPTDQFQTHDLRVPVVLDKPLAIAAAAGALLAYVLRETQNIRASASIVDYHRRARWRSGIYDPLDAAQSGIGNESLAGENRS